MDNLTVEQTKALKALRADRLGFLVMGLVLGGCMIGVAAWGFWNYGVRKVWMLLLGLGYLFVHGGTAIWRDKTEQIRQLREPPCTKENAIHGDFD